MKPDDVFSIAFGMLIGAIIVSGVFAIAQTIVTMRQTNRATARKHAMSCVQCDIRKVSKLVEESQTILKRVSDKHGDA